MGEEFGDGNVLKSYYFVQKRHKMVNNFTVC